MTMRDKIGTIYKDYLFELLHENEGAFLLVEMLSMS